MVLSLLEQILLITMIFFLMIGVGCSLEAGNLKEIKQAKGKILLGLTLQYLSMPLLSLCLCKVMALSPGATQSILLIACCPGGTTSNLFTYFSKANVELSIILTSITTSLAFLMTPLLLNSFSMATHANLTIPFKQLVLILSSILIPVIIGLLIKKKSSALAVKVEKIGSRIGMLAILVMIFIWTPKLFSIIELQDKHIFISLGLINALGPFFGLCISLILKLPKHDARALAFETGIQNAPLAFLIISLSFPKSLIEEFGWIPLVYGALSVGVATAYLTLFRLFDHCSKE